MDTFFSYICENAHYAPLILFGLLLLTGFSLPISEDLILIGGGAIASTCLPDEAYRLYFWLLAGCYVSAWEAYWIGRLLGPKMYHIPLLKSIINPHRLSVLKHYYAKFGVFTFIVGRFCPGGIRNALFMSSGLSKMPFPLFALRDGIAAFISSNILFQIGYRFGKNFDLIVKYFHQYTHWFILFFLGFGFLGSLIYLYYKDQPPIK